MEINGYAFHLTNKLTTIKSVDKDNWTEDKKQFLSKSSSFFLLLILIVLSIFHYIIQVKFFLTRWYRVNNNFCTFIYFLRPVFWITFTKNTFLSAIILETPTLIFAFILFCLSKKIF